MLGLMRWVMLTLLIVNPVLAGNYVWWEGEGLGVTNFPKGSPFAKETLGDARGLLSGGDWLSIGGKQPQLKVPPYARYRIQIAKEATYNLWCRKFWQHGPFRWRFDRQEWTLCPKDVG